MITENVSTLRIHKLSQEQYNRENDAGTLEDNAIYITPDEEVPIAVRTSGTGDAYTATVPNIKSLEIGVSFVMIPHTTNLKSSTTLNVNGFGAKRIMRPSSDGASLNSIGSQFLKTTQAYTVMYVSSGDGFWLIQSSVKPVASDLDGTVPVNKGGTGATTAAGALANLGLTATATELNYMDGVTSNVQTQLDNKMSSNNPTGTGYVSIDRSSGTTIGDNSVAMGQSTAASGTASVALCGLTTASGSYSFANGLATNASGYASHAEGYSSTAYGQSSHAEGRSTNPALSTCTNIASNDTIITDWETAKFSLAKGAASHIEGIDCLALGEYSHAEGYQTYASGTYSHSEGHTTKAKGYYSHAEGCRGTAYGSVSHAEGEATTAIGNYSHSEGYGTTAYGDASHAEGYLTYANKYQHAQGHYNNTTTATGGSSSGTTGTAFVIGNGTSTSNSNAFRVTYAGQPYALSSITTSGCDYAEFFEWQDANLNNEDRRGYFVTLDGEKIKIAEPNDYILGIISGQPAMIGNGDEDWCGRYILDEFGAFITEEFEYEAEVTEEVVSEETGEVTIETKTVKKIGKKYKENPDYDPSREYAQREDRPEWDAVGMIGVLSVRDDGTCQVNGYCEVAEGGIATASDTGYRVIKRVSDNIVKVVFR